VNRNRVVVDVQGLQSTQHGERGIARYVLESSKAVERVSPSSVDRYLLNPELAVPPSAEPLLASGKLRFDSGVLDAASVFHMTSPFEGVPLHRLWPDWARRSDVSLIVTLYDVIPELYPHAYLADSRSATAYAERRAFVRSADLILAISESTGRDAVKVLGADEAKIRVVNAGVSEFFKPANNRRTALDMAQVAVPGLHSSFYLYTGGMDFRKNVEGLLVAYASLDPAVRNSRQLVIVCKLQPSENAYYAQLCHQLNITADVLFTGYVSDETLRLLYQTAHAFVFPSLYEGFGLPLLEAMACGSPVLAGNNSSLVEIVRDPDALFDSSDPDSIASCIGRFESEPQRLAAARARSLPHKYTWSGVGERIAEVYDEELARATRRRAGRRRRLAFVSPMPPSASGVATYSQRLVEALSEFVDVHVFHDGPGPQAVGTPWSIHAFDLKDRQVGGFDRILYCLGNSRHHVGALEGVIHRPGTVLLHDVRLDGLWSGALQHDDPELANLASGIVAGREHAAPSRAPYTTRLDTLELEHVAERATALLLHSRSALNAARLGMPEDLHPKLRVVTFGASPVADGSRRDGSSKCVVSFGMVNERKQSDKVLAAFLDCAQARPEDQFALVGPVERALGQQLEMQIYLRGLDNVVLTGAVTDDAYAGWLAQADVAVQLRGVTNGESSAALMDCFSAGIATVVTELGSTRDLPAGTTRPVPLDISRAALAETLMQLLEDDELREALSRRGREYAAERSFRQAARDLLTAILPEEDDLRLSVPSLPLELDSLH
jgi:glycosyltransferase involved in cell wall biosynthesis